MEMENNPERVAAVGRDFLVTVRQHKPLQG
jgi:hypothetical protein